MSIITRINKAEKRIVDLYNKLKNLPSGGGAIETQNKLITIPLSDLGVAIEDITYEMVSDYINNLGIVVEKGENYYFEVIEVPVPTYNFDLTSPNWASKGITDEASFIARWGSMSPLTNIVVTDFNFVGDRIFCNMTADGTIYNLSGLGLVNADKIGVVNGLTRLNLTSNQIVTFNPTIPLPSDLAELNLRFNQIAEFNPTIPLPNSLTTLDLYSNQIVTFNPSIPLPSSLTTLDLRFNQIAEFNPTIPLPNNLIYLDLSGNQIETFNPSIPLPSGLTTLHLYSNQIVTFNPTIPLPSSLTTLHLYSNQIVTFNPTIPLPSGLTALYLSGNQIVTFNPSIPLPSDLAELNLSYNQMTLAGYTASEVWSNAQPAFTNPCDVYFDGNTDSITGTNLEAILLTKNCVIIS